MHEAALLGDLRRKIEEVARDHRADRVGRVRVWIGALSHLTESHLRSEWPRIVQGTVADRAQLEIEVSGDPNDARAQAVVLSSVTLEQGGSRSTAPSLPGPPSA